jgi:hypothetical protein
MLIGLNSDNSNNNLFVEANLLRSDSDVELPLCIDGNRIQRISNGVLATFKKLKILSTSQQQHTLFRLKFTLKRYVGNVFEFLSSSSIISDPIEVFSHTLYLNDNKQQEPPPPPSLHEVLPNGGTNGTKFVILGSNFVNSPNLRVLFGDKDLQPKYHEQGTLICVAPDIQNLNSNNRVLPIQVSNDGYNFCENKIFFTYLQPQ